MNSPNTLFSKVALTFSIVTLGFNLPLGAEIPQPVRSLLEKRQDAIDKINLVFIRELEKIKIDYTKAGDLENANLVLDFINQTKGAKSTKVSQNDSIETDEPLNGDGKISEIRIKGIFEFSTIRIRKEGLDILHGQFATPDQVTVNRKRWQIEWPNGNTTSSIYPSFDRGLKTLQNSEPKVTVKEGRGEVKIRELPSRLNDFTLLVDVKDGPNGAGAYDIIISW